MWVRVTARYVPSTRLPSAPARRSSHATRSRLGGSGDVPDPRCSSLRSRDSMAHALSITTRSAAPRPNRVCTRSSWPAVSNPASRSSRASPTWASTRSAAVTWAMLAVSPSTPRTRSRIEWSIEADAAEPPWAPGPGSSQAATVAASTSARALAPSPVPRSSRGRSPGMTQTSGSIPPRRATASRSRATAPSVRSSTVTSPPADRRGAAIIVSSADQPASVPPATSTRSIWLGSDTAYHCVCRSNASRRDSHERTCRACCSWRAASRRSCTSRIFSTRCCSAAIRSCRACSSRRTPRPLTTATARQAAAPTPVSHAFSSPVRPSASSRPNRPAAAAQVTLSGRLSRPSSRRCASTHPWLSCSAAGGAGRRGSGPGSGYRGAYCQPRYTRSGRIMARRGGGVTAGRYPGGAALTPADRPSQRERAGSATARAPAVPGPAARTRRRRATAGPPRAGRPGRRRSRRPRRHRR